MLRWGRPHLPASIHGRTRPARPVGAALQQLRQDPAWCEDHCDWSLLLFRARLCWGDSTGAPAGLCLLTPNAGVPSWAAREYQGSQPQGRHSFPVTCRTCWVRQHSGHQDRVLPKGSPSPHESLRPLRQRQTQLPRSASTAWEEDRACQGILAPAGPGHTPRPAGFYRGLEHSQQRRQAQRTGQGLHQVPPPLGGVHCWAPQMGPPGPHSLSGLLKWQKCTEKPKLSRSSFKKFPEMLFRGWSWRLGS